MRQAGGSLPEVFPCRVRPTDYQAGNRDADVGYSQQSDRDYVRLTGGKTTLMVTSFLAHQYRLGQPDGVRNRDALRR